MQFSLAILALAAAAIATPSPQLVSLHGPNGNVEAAVGDYSTDTNNGARSLDTRKTALPNCKGSSYCSTKQGFKNACDVAKGRIQDTTYTEGGTGAGVCDGHCGIFIQSQGGKDAKGNKCAISGPDLANAASQIGQNNCQTCGSVAAPAGGDCEVTMNWVASC